MADQIEVTTNGIIDNTKQNIYKARKDILLTMEKYPSKRHVLWDGESFPSPSDEILADMLEKLHRLENLVSELSDAIDDDMSIVLSVSDRDGFSKTIAFEHQ